MLANLIGCKDKPKLEKQSAFRIDNPSYSRLKNGELVIWENISCNDWQVAHTIMTGHKDDMDNLPMSLVRALSLEEWDFLEKASSALAFLGRMSVILPDITGFIERPWILDSSLRYSFQEMVSKGEMRGKSYNTPQARYALAWWVSITGAIFRIRTKFAEDCPVARVICALLFSKPYRVDWATCNLDEMLGHADFIHGLYKKYEGDIKSATWDKDVFTTLSAGLQTLCNPIFYLAANLGALKQLARVEEDVSLPETGKRIAWGWLPDHIEVFDAWHDLGALPQTAAAIRINTVSNAYIPMYAAYDECDMPMVLIPENPEIWDAMLGLYDIPRRDLLYPESSRVMDQLLPRNAHFAAEMSETHNLVYLGVRSLGEYLPELTDADNPDYQFHVFAADISKWKKR